MDPCVDDRLDAEAREFLSVLEERRVEVVFQPLLDLHTSQTVGFEALARGPEGPMRTPAALFAQAARLGRTAELDWVCRAAAFQAALDADLPPGLSLFVNVEATTGPGQCPADLVPVVTRAESSLRVFLEVNDRALVSDPAGLLATLDRAREVGWGLSMDDVGVSLGCLSVLPMVEADVVKLNVGLLRERGRDINVVVTTVLRHVESFGASLVVKGIETEDDAQFARALGAAYGQGHHLGAPAEPAGPYGVVRSVVPLISDRREVPQVSSPGEMLSDHQRRTMSRASMDQVAEIFATRALSAGSRPLVLMGVGSRSVDPTYLEGIDGLTLLAEKSVLLAAFGVNVPPEPVPGVRGVNLRPVDPLAEQLFLVIMTEHLAMAMVAERSTVVRGQLDVVVTQEAGVVSAVAEHLLRRVPGVGPKNRALPAPDGPGPQGVHEPAEDEATGAVLPQQRTRWSRLQGLLGHP